MLKNKFPTLETDKKKDLMNSENKKIYYIKNNNNEFSNRSDLFGGMTRVNLELVKKVKREKKNISCNINKSDNNLNQIISLKFNNEQNSKQKEENNHKIYKIRKVEFNNYQNISNLKNNSHLNYIKSDLEINGRSELSTKYCSTSTSDIYPKFKYKRKIKNNKMKELNFLKNKKKAILLLEMEKRRIMNENFKNYQKYLSLIQKQKKEFDEYDKYLEKGLDDSQETEKKFETIKNCSKKKGTKSYFNILKNQKLSNSLQNIKKENNLYKSLCEEIMNTYDFKNLNQFDEFILCLINKNNVNRKRIDQLKKILEEDNNKNKNKYKMNDIK
jgi:hypothetical protein